MGMPPTFLFSLLVIVLFFESSFAYSGHDSFSLEHRLVVESTPHLESIDSAVKNVSLNAVQAVNGLTEQQLSSTPTQDSTRTCGKTLNTEEIFFCDINSIFNPPLEQFTVDMSNLNGDCLTKNQSSASDFSNDLCVCSCLESNSNKLDGQTYLAAKSDSSWNKLLQEQMNQNISRLNLVLEAEQNAMRFQASTLPASDRAGSFVSSAYTKDFNVDVSASLNEINLAAKKKYESMSSMKVSGAVAMDPITVKPAPGNGSSEGDRLLWSQPLSDDQCIPLRTEMTSRQMPTNPIFFEDIARLPEKFDPIEWDYNKLKTRFIAESQGSKIKKLDDILNDPNPSPAKRTYQRLQFLERNPLYKNLFSSDYRNANTDTMKQKLWDMIRGAYGKPDMKTDEKVSAFKKLRHDTGVFFTNADPEVNIIAMTKAGADVNMKAIISGVPTRVESISTEFKPEEIWRQVTNPFNLILTAGAVANKPASFLTNSAGSDTPKVLSLLGMSEPDQATRLRQSPEAYAAYCPRLNFANEVSQRTVLKELEENLGRSYTSDPWMNEVYIEMNKNVCIDERVSRDGKTRMRFSDFFHSLCAPGSKENCSAENKPALVARFLKEFPINSDATKNDSDSVAALVPFLIGADRIPNFTENSAVQARITGQNKNFTRSPEFNRQLSSVNSEISNSSSQGKVIGSPSSIASNSQTAARTPASSSVTSPALSQSGISESVYVPSVTPVIGQAAAPTEVFRTNIRKESGAQGIREDIQDLRREMERESDKPSPSSDIMNSLSARIAALEANIQEKDKEIARIRNQPQRVAVESQANPASRNEFPSETRRADSRPSFAPSVATSVQPQSNAASGSSMSPDFSSRNFGTSSGLAPSSPRVSSIANYSALLSKYGVKSLTNQGSITVASPSGTIDYQGLKNQSESSTVALPLSREDYAKVSNSEEAIKGYLDRCPAKAEVCRLSFSIKGSTEALDVFVLISENEVSIIPSNQASRSIASEKTVPEARTERVNTLEYLQQVVAPR